MGQQYPPAQYPQQPQYPQYPAAAARPADWDQRAGLIGGIAAVVGGLCVLGMIFLGDETPPTSVIVATVLAFLGGVGAVVLSLLFRDLLRSALLTATGILVLVALIIFMWASTRRWMSPVHFLTFAALPLVVGGIIARRRDPQSQLARWVLLGLAAAVIIIQLIWGIVLLAGATRGARRYARMLDVDGPLGALPIMELMLLMITVWGVMVMGLVSSLVRGAVRPLTRWGITAFVSFLGARVLLEIVTFLVVVADRGMPPSEIFLGYILAVLTGTAFLVGGSLLASIPFGSSLGHIQRMLRPRSAYPGHVAYGVPQTGVPFPAQPYPAQAQPGPPAQPVQMPAPATPPPPQPQPTPLQPGVPPAPEADVAAQLMRLKQLLDKGLITEADFKRKREDMLDRM